jgi:hypothetical protein
VSSDQEPQEPDRMNWPRATINIVSIFALVAIVFIICGNDILKGWLT